MTDPDEPRRRYKVSVLSDRSADKRSYITPDLEQALRFLHKDLSEALSTDQYLVEIKYLSDTEWDSLPEWRGW